LANEKAIEQICSLQCRTGRSGRDSVNARGGAPEDIANVGAAVCAMIEKHSRRYVRFTALSTGGDDMVIGGRYVPAAPATETTSTLVQDVGTHRAGGLGRRRATWPTATRPLI
jgi:hypothetical protein